MSLTRKDAAAVVPTVLVVLVYLANSHDWNVPLLASNRWAAGAILVLGMATCSLGRASEMTKDPTVSVLALLGGAALILFAVTMWTNAQWALGLFALDTVVLWAGSTLRHATLHGHGTPHPA